MNQAGRQPETNLFLPDMSFTIGVFEEPHNPDGFPDTFPFQLVVDEELGLLVQEPNDALQTLLDRAYAAGSLLGTAMDASPLGKAYADDFIRVVSDAPGGLSGRTTLEIGAGRGYLVRRLVDAGADAVGLEPGAANKKHWIRHQVSVVQDRFPSRRAKGPFDLIVAYGVLEHIPDPVNFLAEVRRHLTRSGYAVIAVPDCAPYIEAGDPSMLVHEHYSYFTQASLRRLVNAGGFEVVEMRRAGYGGAVYCIAVPGDTVSRVAPDESELDALYAFARKCRQQRCSFRAMLADLEREGRSVGIFCPARALALLPSDTRVRFFDDDPDLAGRYFPPFVSPVEDRARLLAQPVDELWIMSRTFGAPLAAELGREPALARTRVRLAESLICEPMD